MNTSISYGVSLNQECFRAWEIVRRFFGFCYSKPLIRSWAYDEISYFRVYLALIMSLWRSDILLALNGTVPYSIAKSTTPADQASIPKP